MPVRRSCVRTPELEATKISAPAPERIFDASAGEVPPVTSTEVPVARVKAAPIFSRTSTVPFTAKMLTGRAAGASGDWASSRLPQRSAARGKARSLSRMPSLFVGSGMESNSAGSAGSVAAAAFSLSEHGAGQGHHSNCPRPGAAQDPGALLDGAAGGVDVVHQQNALPGDREARRRREGAAQVAAAVALSERGLGARGS